MTMAVKSIFDVAGQAMSAQMVRMNTVASNLANAGTTSSTAAGAYRALRPVFATDYANATGQNGEDGLAGVQVDGVVALNRAPQRIYQPGDPNADAQGYVYQAAVNPDEEMVEMMDASRQYQNTVDVISTVRALMARTIKMGQ